MFWGDRGGVGEEEKWSGMELGVERTAATTMV